jgi:hypothetical protein
VSLEDKGFSKYSSTVQRTHCWLIHQLQWPFINLSSQGKLNVVLRERAGPLIRVVVPDQVRVVPSARERVQV